MMIDGYNHILIMLKIYINYYNKKRRVSGYHSAVMRWRVGHYNGCVKFECNDGYDCIQKTILNGDDLSV
jgi:hypothetical protein